MRPEAGSPAARRRVARAATAGAGPPLHRGVGLRHGRAALLCAALCAAAPAAGQSFAPPLVGGFTFAGPARPHVTDIYYNPAAIGPLDGTAFHLSFDATLDTIAIDRAPIDPATGAPVAVGTPGARAFPGVRERGFAPGGFFGLTSDLGTDNVTVGVAVFTPFYERRSPGSPAPTAAGDGPTRYHLLDLTQYHLYITPAVALRVSKRLYVGLGLDVVYSDLASLTFDRDTALDGGACTVATNGFESDACVERLHVHGSVWSIGVPLGVLVRPTDHLDIGLSYHTAVFGTTRTNVPFIGAGELTLPGATTPVPVLARTSTHVPQTLLAAVRLDLGPRVDLSVDARWLHWPGPEVVEVRLARATNVTATVPERIPLYRGYHDAFTFRALTSFRPKPYLRLGLGAIVAPPPLGVRETSPAAVEGWELWGFVLAEVEATRWLTLGAGYGLRGMVPRSVDASIFDPFYQVDCAASRYDIPTCRPANLGRGIASGAGNYSSLGHHLGLTTTVHF